jgi:hypothetical protein
MYMSSQQMTELERTIMDIETVGSCRDGKGRLAINDEPRAIPASETTTFRLLAQPQKPRFQKTYASLRRSPTILIPPLNPPAPIYLPDHPDFNRDTAGSTPRQSRNGPLTSAITDLLNWNNYAKKSLGRIWHTRPFPKAQNIPRGSGVLNIQEHTPCGSVERDQRVGREKYLHTKGGSTLAIIHDAIPQGILLLPSSHGLRGSM